MAKRLLLELIRIGGLIFLSTGFLCMGCSTLPREDEPQRVTETKDRAAEYADFGNRYFEQGKFEQAERFFSMSLDFNLTVDNEKGIIESYNSLGKVHTAQGNYSEAQGYFSAAYQAADRINDDGRAAQSLNNMGELLLQQDKLKSAISKFNKSLELFQNTTDDSPEEAILLHNLGAAYKKLEQYDQALEYLNKALSINLDDSNYIETAANYYMIASVYSKKKQYEIATAHMEKALANDKMIENSYGIAKDLFALGIIHDKWNRTAAAYDYYKRAFLVFSTMETGAEAIKVLRKLKNVAEQLGYSEEVAVYEKSIQEYEKEQTQ